VRHPAVLGRMRYAEVDAIAQLGTLLSNLAKTAETI
jgi:hypothetical protein